jgi:two-component system, cell cycle sensor histidine kinase and response regulator CckA
MAHLAARPSDAVVLVVDDEDLVRRLMSRTLTEAGYEVVEARSGVEAVTLLAAAPGRIQLVVSDIAMPGMTGLDLAGVIAERWPMVPMLLVSGQVQPPPEFRGCFLPKPFTPDSLVAVAVSLLPGG